MDRDEQLIVCAAARQMELFDQICTLDRSRRMKQAIEGLHRREKSLSGRAVKKNTISQSFLNIVYI